MIHNTRRIEKERQKAKTRNRYRTRIEPDEYIPGSKPTDYYDNDISQRVAIYVRVSTDDVRQTTSFELQKKYYEDFVIKHPNWTLVDIYADEGISGTSLNKREAFNTMIADCKLGRIDLIITKSISRFARNVVDCISTVRDLAERNPPVGVFFESESIYSLNEDSQLALSFQATMAEEESHIRSRSMETSLRMRLDNGIPLTPTLLGYQHDEDGNLVINPEEASTVKLAFFMYLYGYSTQQIAEIFNKLGRKSYWGNVDRWSSSTIYQILRNERHCGDVLTRKTFTPNYRTHKSKKNTGQRPQSRYKDHHEAIVSRDDFIAVQHMLDNAKYKNKLLPELHVIGAGLLKGFVIVNTRFAGFKAGDYYQAACSVYQDGIYTEEKKEITIEVGESDLDLRGFEIARGQFFDVRSGPKGYWTKNTVKFNTTIVRGFGEKNRVELLINPLTKQLAVRPADSADRNGVVISKLSGGKYHPKPVSTSAIRETIYGLFDWNMGCNYRMLGNLYEHAEQKVYIFDAKEAECFISDSEIHVEEKFSTVRDSFRAVPETWVSTFGKQFYIQENDLIQIENKKETEGGLHLRGQLYENENQLNVTSTDELKRYIEQELNGITIEGGRDDVG